MPNLKDQIELDERGLERKEGTLEQIALSRYKRHVADNSTQMAEFRTKANLLQRFVSPRGEQWPEKVKELFDELAMPTLSLNEMWPTIAAIAGREVTSRYVPKLTGRDEEDQGLADAFNSGIKVIRETEDYEQADSSAYRTCHISGISATHIAPKLFVRVPKFPISKVPLAELLIDFFSRDPNYSDMTAIARGQWVNIYEMMEYSPDYEKDWETLVNSGEHQADFDPGTHGGTAGIWNASIGLESQNARFYRRASKEVFRVDFEWRDFVPRVDLEIPGEAVQLWEMQLGSSLPDEKDLDDEGEDGMPNIDALALITAITEQYLAAAETGDIEAIAILSGQDPQALAQAAQQGQQPQHQPQEPIYRQISKRQLVAFRTAYSQATGRTYEQYYDVRLEKIYHAVIVGNMVTEVYEKPDNDWDIHLLPCFMDEADEGSVPYGSAELMMPRQEWANMLACLWIHLLATMPKGQMVVNKEDLEPGEIETLNQQAAQGDRIIALSGGKDAIGELPKGTMPDGVEQAMLRWPDLVPAAVGQSKYGIGNVTDSLSRTAFRLVDQQVATQDRTLSEAVDNLRLYRKRQTRSLIKKIIAYWSYRDFLKAAGKFGKHVPKDKSLWRRALEFDLVVSEEPVTKDQSETIVNALQQTAMWQYIAEVAPKALAKAHAPIFGSEMTAEWLLSVENREPDRAVESLAKAFGLDPQMVSQAIQTLQQQTQQQQQGAPQ